MEEFITVRDKKFYCPICKKYRLRVRDGAESQEGVEVICRSCLKKMREKIAEWERLKPDIKKWKEGYEATEEMLKNNSFGNGPQNLFRDFFNK